jgi:hypothetical protein
VDGRIFFNQEDLESHQSLAQEMAQSVADSVDVNLDDASETDLLRKLDRIERPRKSTVPGNWSQDDDYATFPVSRDGVQLALARQESRENFPTRKYIRHLQEAGSKPSVTARTVHYVENRHSAVKKLEEENKDEENLSGPSGSMTKYGHKDWRPYRCECNTWDFKPSKSVSHATEPSNKSLVLTNLGRYNVPIARTTSTPCAMAIILQRTHEFQIYITATPV